MCAAQPQVNDSDKTPLKLNAGTLSALSESVQTPEYDREALGCGILHMSVGGFHRAHEAVYLDDLLAQFPEDWMICAVGLRPEDAANVEALNSQDGLYTVLERSAGEDHLRVVGAIKEAILAPADPVRVLERMCDPAIRIVSLTITEKGYCYDSGGNLDLRNPDIRAELSGKTGPGTAIGYLVHALAHRFDAGIAPFTVMSCDNLPGNGDLTRKLVLQYAMKADPGLAGKIAAEVAFPNAMVDRITPATTGGLVQSVQNRYGIGDQWPVMCEDFRQWVLEDSFCNGRPALEHVGVQMVRDVEPYEKMKVRLLNGSHSALAYISYLIGYRNVDEAMADPLVAKFVRRYMDEEVTPSLPAVPGIQLDTYKDKLIERFSNPAISDKIQRLAEDGSRKIPNAILPCMVHQLENNGPIRMAALALAAWFAYLRGVDEQLKPIEIRDPMAAELTGRMRIDSRDPSRVLDLAQIFGTELPQNGRFREEIGTALARLHDLGARQTLEIYCA